MKKIIITGSILFYSIISAQYKVKVDAPAYLSDSESYLYGFNGSKEILLAKGKSSKNQIEFSVDKKYIGMMRAYFQKVNAIVNMVSENKDIAATVELDAKNKVSNVTFRDEANLLMTSEQDLQKKKNLILPALVQIKEYYKPNDVFYKSLESEISNLSGKDDSYSGFPFIAFYHNSQKFNNPEKISELTAQDFIDFFSKSSEYLETSMLLNPTLINYLNLSKGNVEPGVDNLLKAVNVETPRGQTILSELIEIFTTYNMDKLKEKYLTEAKNLKCTINDRLASTINANKNVELGAKMPNNVFQNPIHTKAKSLYDVKAAKKIVVFWSSTCSHCEAELPKLLEKYSEIKAQNIEIVGLSMDSNLDDFRNKANMFPWVSDSEGKGWYSSYSDTYNVSATPTYFILDANNVIIDKPDHVTDVLEYLKIK